MHRSARRRLSAALFILALGALAGIFAVGAHARASAGSMPRLGAIPDFRMLDQDGHPVGRAELRGQALVVDFFFASCTSSCPRLAGRMGAIGRAVQDREHTLGRRLAVRLVSITLDPDNDTPAVLSEYAGRLGATSDRWAFLSGRSEELDRIVVKGFKVSYERTDPKLGVGAILHGEWLVLVDPVGEIRGYYAASDAERMAAIVRDVLDLAGDRAG